MIEFEYLLEKIEKAKFSMEPFKHIYIENFFSEEHFQKIVNSEEIKLPDCSNDDELFRELFKRNYSVINFPGCTTDYKKYIKEHNCGAFASKHSACESSGIALRLKPTDNFLVSLDKFLCSKLYNELISKKFNVDLDNCTTDGGIQKYLDGYEISPHPDIRQKAATFMVNINPSPISEDMDHHTHYMTFNKEREYINTLWENNLTIDPQWVPWDWCQSVFQQTKNNSIVLFSPSAKTLHAVKASYDHLKTQRTQLYGNIWYKESPASKILSWEDLDLLNARFDKTSPRFSKVKNLLNPIKGLFKDKNVNKRDY